MNTTRNERMSKLVRESLDTRLTEACQHGVNGTIYVEVTVSDGTLLRIKDSLSIDRHCRFSGPELDKDKR